MGYNGLTGKKHPNWKGGKTVLSSGYIGIRVPMGHHLRMKNAYAYEHQLIAEEKLGRNLKPGEIVHHINGKKTDNRPENIEICSSLHEHKTHHRGEGSNRRFPNQINPMVCCGCGCGEQFVCFDESGRPRKYIRGHSRKKREGKSATS
jgi:hypothetical protein